MIDRLHLLVMVAVLGVASPARAEKNETVSFGLAAGGTAVSSGLAVGAILFHGEDDEYNKPLLIAGLASAVVTPSLGHLYSEQWLTVGMGIRGLAGALALWGLSMTNDAPCVVDPNENCPTTTGGGLTLVSLAAIAFIGGVAYDVRDSRGAAARYNKKHTSGFALAPTAMPHGAGLSLVGAF
jgi:hypothetical protein